MKLILIGLMTLIVGCSFFVLQSPPRWSDHDLLVMRCNYEGRQTCSTSDLKYICRYKMWMPVVGSCGQQLKCGSDRCCVMPRRGMICER